MEKTIKIPGQLQTRASLQASTFNDDAGTVEVVWTTGARGMRSGWGERYFEELEVSDTAVDMSRLNNGASVLNSHSSYDLRDVIGVVERAWIAKGEGRALIRFSEREDVKPIRADVKSGVLRHISVGYSVQKYEKVEETDGVPVYRATRWTPAEISIVPVAFDDKAVVRAQSQEVHEVVVETRGEPPHEESSMSEVKQQETAAAQTDAARMAEIQAASDLAAKAERERAAGIRLAVRSAKLGDELADQLVNDGIAVDKARTIVLTKLAEKNAEVRTEQHTPVTGGEDARDKRLRGMASSIFARSGQGIVFEAKRQGKKGFEKVDEDAGEFRGMSLVDMARFCLEQAGANVRGVYDRMRIAEMAMRSGYASANDFPVLLENVLHKQLRASYETQANQWRRFCKTDTVGDFRQAHRYMTGTLGTLPVVKPGAEYQNMEIPDGSKVSIDVETRGAIIAVGREMIVNDDLGAFVNLATNFGSTAGRTIEKAVFDLLQQNAGLGPTLTDGNTFFHASRGNIGTGAALSVSSLVADKVKMRKLQDKDGVDYLDLLPRILLVPAELESDANIININETDPTSGAQQGKKNAAKGMFGDIVSSPRLTSATRRWMFTDRKEAFVVVFLDNADEGPTLSQQEGFRRDAVEWKARIDVKVCPYDPKTAQVNAGV